MTKITKQEIMAARSPKGGWTRKTLAQWGVPWPPPGGWKASILANGIPYQSADGARPKGQAEIITQEGLQRAMDASAPVLVDGDPFECEGDLDIDAAQLLRKVVGAVISHGQGHILYDFPEVLAFFGSRIPQRHEVSHLHGVDERMFDAAGKWPNRRPA